MNRAPGSARRRLRAAAGLTTTAVLLAGLPYALIRFTGWPLPRQVPAWPQVKAFLTTPLSDDAIVTGLACVVWLLWVIFALSLIVEASASACGWQAPRLPGIAPVQAFAAALVGATVLTAVPVPQASPQPAPLHSVLATHMIAANPAQPSDTATATRTGVASALSASDNSNAAASEAATPHPRIHRVVEGDNLWDIAERYLGTGENWHEIFKLNRSKPQPDGQTLTQPGLIEPGWVLLLPARLTTRPGPPTGAAKPHAPGLPPVRTPASPPSPGRLSLSSRPALPSESPKPPGGSGAAHRPAAHVRPHPHPRSQAVVNLPSGALVGLSLAIAAGLAILAARLHRRRWRQPAPVPGTAPADPALGPALRRLRHAQLTGISRQTHDPGTEPEDTEPPATARPPAADDSIPPRHEASTETVNVAVRDGHEISLNLASAPGIGFAGPGAAAVIRAIAIALLARRTRDQAEVILCGKDAWRLLTPAADEPFLTAVPGLTALPGADQALRQMESEIIHRRRLLDAAEDDDLAAYRAANPDEHLPTILVIAPAHGPRAPRLAAVLALGQQLGITGALPGAWPPGVTCEVAADGQVTTVTAAALRDLEGSQMFQLAPTDAGEMLTTLAAANSAAHPPDPGRPRLLPAPPQNAAESRDLAVHVSVLGPFQLLAAGKLITKGLRRKAAELLTYLAVHREGATTEVILEALWPDTPPGRAAPILHAATTNIRKILRDATTTPEGAFIIRVGEHLRIDPRQIEADLWHFEAQLAAAAHASDDQARTASLRAAASLWRGDLAEGIDAVWIEQFRETLRRDAVDTLARLAQLSEQQNPEQALVFLERAISIDRYQEPLYQRIIHIQGNLRRPDAARRTYQLLESRLTELDAEPDQTTAQLLHQVL